MFYLLLSISIITNPKSNIDLITRFDILSYILPWSIAVKYN